MATRKFLLFSICSNEEESVEFWRQTIYEYSFSVSFQFEASPKSLVKQFTIFDRVPSGIPAIMQVLFNRGILSTREEMLSGTYYQPKQSKSMLRNLASGIYSYTIGSFWSDPEPEPVKETYVVVEFLDRQADQLLNWASKTENNLHSEISLKRQLRKSTTHSEADI